VGYLLDTNVVSEVRKPRPHPRVATWFASVDAGELYLSALVVGEIFQGIERLRRRDPERAAGYGVWLAQLRTSYADRIVPVDADVAVEWGRMNSVTRLPVVDGLLAATARVRGWTLVTRNVRDVAGTGARILDPFAPPA